MWQELHISTLEAYQVLLRSYSDLEYKGGIALKERVEANVHAYRLTKQLFNDHQCRGQDVKAKGELVTGTMADARFGQNWNRASLAHP